MSTFAWSEEFAVRFGLIYSMSLYAGLCNLIDCLVCEVVGWIKDLSTKDVDEMVLNDPS